MPRYILQFADKTTKRVSEQDAQAIIRALSEKKPVIFRGAYFAPHHIVAVKPITKTWFPEDAAAIEEGADNSARGTLPPAERVKVENARFLASGATIQGEHSMERMMDIAKRNSVRSPKKP